MEMQHVGALIRRSKFDEKLDGREHVEEAGTTYDHAYSGQEASANSNKQPKL